MLEKIKKKFKMKSPESRLAHKYLDGLSGLEIGGSAHNPFGLNTKNVDFTDDMDTMFKREERRNCGEAMCVDMVAPGDELPVLDNSQDFVISSHVLEHFPDPIKALKEWYRVIRPGGYIFMIVPHKDRTFDRNQPRTTLKEVIGRHENNFTSNSYKHFSFWITVDVVEIVKYLGWKIIEVQDVDDKAGNGFTIIIQKTAKDEVFEDISIFKPNIYWKSKNKIYLIIMKIFSARINTKNHK